KDSVPIISTNLIANMGQLYPVLQTNVVTNAFDLLSAEVATNLSSTVSTSVVYRFVQTGASNYVTLDHVLPDDGPVIFAADIVNQGITYHMTHTNSEHNLFDLVSAKVTSNVVDTLQYSYGYDSFGFMGRLVWPTPLDEFTPLLLTNTIVVT